jgi:hypothetical protein
MGYLIYSDFKRLIQSDNLTQILGGDTAILTQFQQAAVSECISYLSQKYITAQEFSDTTAYAYANTYNVHDRIYLDADAFSQSTSYVVGDIVLYAGIVYRCTTNHLGLWDASHFTLIGAQYALFYVPTPYIPTTTTRMDEFDYKVAYSVDDYVYWKGKYYRCRIATSGLDHESALQFRTIENLPLPNVFPDDPNNGVQYWGTGTAYVAAEKFPTNTTYWQSGDNRNPQMVNYCIDICLYHLHSRISPRNIPELRINRYDDAISWLKKAANGDITASLPLIQPRAGGRIRYAGNVKQINSY